MRRTEQSEEEALEASEQASRTEVYLRALLRPLEGKIFATWTRWRMAEICR